MKLPISWLREYVTFDADAEGLAERLTFSGVEVEGIETVGSDYTNVVVAEVRQIAPHPSADRLTLCRVHDGQQELSIVCGADNYAVGDKVPLARIGAELPGGMVIKEARLRGELSQGMLCAEDELGLSDDHSGIMLLARETPAGTPLSAVVGPPETVLEVEITWNRPDCLSISGLAREVAALYGTEVRRPSVEFEELGDPVAGLASVVIEDSAGCPRYTARVLSAVKTGPSPLWMQRRLTWCGVRPISNVVDITNYVLLECGQPLHAFDYELLHEHRIIVRRAAAGEKMATLDGIDRTLDPETLVIADPNGAVAVAGVMGGAGSEIGGATTRVLLESASFAAPGIARTSARLGLTTESSYRFARGVDVGQVDWCSRRAAALMVAHAGAVAASGVVDVYPGRPKERRVSCRFSRVNGLIGVDVPADEVVSIFERLELPVAERTAEACSVSVPTFRMDVELEADLIEEVARMHGLDKLPDVAPPTSIVPDADDSRTRAMTMCRSNLVALGLTEAMNYSFLSELLLDAVVVGDPARRVVLPNPVSADHGVLRNSLVPQMVAALGRNLSYQTSDVSLFEMGRVFGKDAEGGILERERVCIGLMGKVGRGGQGRREALRPDEMFLWMKGITAALCRVQRVADVTFAPASEPCLEAGWSVAVEAGGRRLGIMGLVSEAVRQKWRMSEPVGVAELDVDPLLEHAFDTRVLEPVPVYPSVARDVALIVGEQVTHADVVRVIRAAAPPELTRVELFDIFTGKGIGEGRKSMAYSLVFRSHQKSLTDEDANEYHGTIKEALRKELNAEIREG